MLEMEELACSMASILINIQYKYIVYGNPFVTYNVVALV